MIDQCVDNPPRYPTDRFSGQGIVLCAGGDAYFPCAWVCIQMLRFGGCRLPIELWYRGAKEMNDRMLALLRALDVRCVDAYAVAREHPVRRLDGWELKPYAILHSGFEHVLYLDADNVPVRDPSFLFDTPQYRETGAIFWPDRYSGNGSGVRWLKREAWRICRVPFRDEAEIEAGQLVIDKRRSWRALQLTMHLNEHSDFHYAYFYGDKDTFHLAWRRVGQAYCLIPYGPRILGQDLTIVQHDFQGEPLFQHRNGDKWRLHGDNRPISGFRFEQECLRSLEQLRERWDGSVRQLPRDFSACERAAYDEIVATVTYRYRLQGRGEHVLAFRPDFTIGRGVSTMETGWRLEEDKDGQPTLIILNAGGPTCRLRQNAAGSWTGRWLSYDRLAVELEAATESTFRATTAPARRAEKAILAIACFRYQRIGYDERTLELRADHTIGRGAARCERYWAVQGTEQDLTLTLFDADHEPTCRLDEVGANEWRGRWLRFEKMPISLRPVDGEPV